MHGVVRKTKPCLVALDPPTASSACTLVGTPRTSRPTRRAISRSASGSAPGHRLEDVPAQRRQRASQRVLIGKADEGRRWLAGGHCAHEAGIDLFARGDADGYGVRHVTFSNHRHSAMSFTRPDATATHRVRRARLFVRDPPASRATVSACPASCLCRRCNRS